MDVITIIGTFLAFALGAALRLWQRNRFPLEHRRRP